MGSSLHIRERAAPTSQEGEPRRSFLAFQAASVPPAKPSPVALEFMGFSYWRTSVTMTLSKISSLTLSTRTTRSGNLSSKRRVSTASLQTTKTTYSVNNDIPPNGDNQASPIDSHPLATGWEALEACIASSKYRRKRSALETEFTSLLARSTSPPKSLDKVSPRDIIYFLIWKDKDSKTQVHREACPHQGPSSKPTHTCGCPHRLAF